MALFLFIYTFVIVIYYTSQQTKQGKEDPNIGCFGTLLIVVYIALLIGAFVHGLIYPLL